MQQLHVRNIFKLIIPFVAETPPRIDVSSSPANFGFTVIFPNTETHCSYRIQLYSDIQYGPGKSKTEKDINSTDLLHWGKKTATTFKTREPNNTIEAIILHLRIGPGFDFRKVPRRYVRFEVECFASGSYQYKGITKVCQLLGKRRHASDSDLDEVSIPVLWQHFDAPTLDSGDLDEVHSLEDSSSGFNNNSGSEDPSPNNNSFHHLGSDGEVVSTPNELPQSLVIPDPHFMFDEHHVQNDHRSLATNTNIMSYHAYSPEHDMIVPRDQENYMVLYNGNAEVVGNFRALNFYKASDINIKEDIRLIIDNHDPRDVLLKIDGVSYKFKPGTTHSTQRRFVGYIAQQIESVVPEAVQLIDGILHVDYESLIPYLSESIKQNFTDIKNTKQETQKIHEMVDQLFSEFADIRERHNSVNSASPSSDTTKTKSRSRVSWYKLLVGISLATLLLVSVAIGALLLYEGHRNNNIPLTPVDGSSSGLHPWTALHALRLFYNSTNGPYWDNNTGWVTTDDFCLWYGITCQDGIVTKINLSNNSVQGFIPGNFTIPFRETLQELDLSSNHLFGSLPTDFTALRRVNKINLSDNILSGSLPQITEATFPMLHHLDLSSNHIEGSIPSIFVSLATLKYLNLSTNMLDGTIPNMERTPPTVVDFSWNYLQGSVPIIASLSASLIDFSHNKLSGEIRPTSFRMVEKLNLRYNSLTGVFEISVLDKYKELDISNNKFSAFKFLFFVNQNSTIIPTCNAANNPFKCPLPSWIEEHCSATCSF
eukprot:TRINITY_DN1754_c0_g4_i3.p1 TRINITY_DN1754_c0_g4~~TRINITY_DN1754_c0_g4_i3.p1  ORF type:complete len:766 (+),score=63.35 TRINITY_DN1754_c0_g4_i3:1-2298(+)